MAAAAAAIKFGLGVFFSAQCTRYVPRLIGKFLFQTWYTSSVLVPLASVFFNRARESTQAFYNIGCYDPILFVVLLLSL